MTGLPGFTVQIDQNPYLPVGGRDVSAVVTVTADAEPTDGAPSWSDSADGSAEGSAEIIIVDCSGSMDFPPEKILAARAAVDVIRDGARFGIVAGTSTAWPVYPTDGSMAVADARTRAEARQAVAGLRSNGGAAIGQWLRPPPRVFPPHPAP